MALTKTKAKSTSKKRLIGLAFVCILLEINILSHLIRLHRDAQQLQTVSSTLPQEIVDAPSTSSAFKVKGMQWDTEKLMHCPDHTANATSRAVYPLPLLKDQQTSSEVNTLRIPPNMIINSKDGHNSEPDFIQANIQSNLNKLPGWSMISDDDATCLQKIQRIDAYNSSEMMEQWFNSPQTKGMFKSDVCRMAQLYLHGGLYLDNDVELVSSAVLNDLKGGFDLVSSIALGGELIFQAILAAPPNHPLIWRAMKISVEVLFKGRKLDGWFGPAVVQAAIEEMYNQSYRLDTQSLLCKGVLLFSEVELQKDHPGMVNRTHERFCNVAVVDTNQQLYAFSRVKQWGTTDQMCHN